MLKKLQHFLKNKYKFEKAPDTRDVIEGIQKLSNDLTGAIKSDNVPVLKTTMTNMIIEMIKVANRKDIDVENLLQELYNLN